MPAEPRLLLFVVASAVLILTPGPAVLYIVARSLEQGRNAGLASAAGVALGNLVYAIATALGVSALLASSPTAYRILHYAGAAYLVYLGARKFLPGPPVQAVDPSSRETLPRTFRQAVVVALFNPKTALFFVAFLPQFVVADRGAVGLQLLALGVTFVLMAAASDSLYATLAGRVGSALRGRGNLLRSGRWLSGTVYCALGCLAAFAG